LNALLGLVGLAIFSGLAWLFYVDVRTTLRESGSQHSADREAQRALGQLTAENGWYPYLHDPVYDFDDGLQGWVMQDDIGRMAMLATHAAGGAERNKVGGLSLCPAPDGQGQVLQLPVAFPDPTTVIRETNQGPEDARRLQGVRFVSYDVFVPADCPG
jgi:hypothetical protein